MQLKNVWVESNLNGLPGIFQKVDLLREAERQNKKAGRKSECEVFTHVPFLTEQHIIGGEIKH